MLSAFTDRDYPFGDSCHNEVGHITCIQLIASQRFNLFVLDMELPDISGMDIIVRIREKDPRARIIVNTMHEEIWFIKDLIQRSVPHAALRPNAASVHAHAGCT